MRAWGGSGGGAGTRPLWGRVAVPRFDWVGEKDSVTIASDELFGGWRKTFTAPALRGCRRPPDLRRRRHRARRRRRAAPPAHRRGPARRPPRRGVRPDVLSARPAVLPRPPDRPTAVTEWYRVTAPGGTVAVATSVCTRARLRTRRSALVARGLRCRRP
ncbi:hypothetical protein KSE_75525 [Kitasatospora setae KM-6054]|uniref:Uncharacterized protein n=1 Tax=Kitasatospora setae (strain ATCC 33774 / DSM 43861 / JCM 3304 / KCC A-0304 / NBRC 14216 / KM-6054) TaxID=452652 RepID=E4NK07_KITSK|nr:hypothetical protein KSE_75525 [Kitasatospora setae KM-6054]